MEVAVPRMVPNLSWASERPQETCQRRRRSTCSTCQAPTASNGANCATTTRCPLTSTPMSIALGAPCCPGAELTYQKAFQSFLTSAQDTRGQEFVLSLGNADSAPRPILLHSSNAGGQSGRQAAGASESTVATTTAVGKERLSTILRPHCWHEAPQGNDL